VSERGFSQQRVTMETMKLSGMPLVSCPRIIILSDRRYLASSRELALKECAYNGYFYGSLDDLNEHGYFYVGMQRDACLALDFLSRSLSLSHERSLSVCVCVRA